jgi:hypothetical protein
MKRVFIFAVGLIVCLTACNVSTAPVLPSPGTPLEGQASDWQRVGGAVAIGDVVPKLALDQAANPYVAWYEVAIPSQAFVKTWNGSVWMRLGGKLNVNPDSYIVDLAIAIDSSNRPVVAWSEFNRAVGQNYVYVKRWTGTTWTRVGTTLATSYSFYVKLALVADQPLIAFDNDDPSISSTRSVFVKRWNGSQWQDYGGVAAKVVTFSLALSTTQDPVLAYEQYSNNTLSVNVKRWQNGTWTPLGTALNIRADSSTKPPLIAIGSNNLPVVVWSEYTNFDSDAVTLYAKRWNGSSWSSLGSTISSQADEYSANLTLDSTNAPVVTWTQDYNTSPTTYVDRALYVSRWKSTSNTWGAVGTNPMSSAGGYAGNVFSPSVAFANNTLTATWLRMSAVINGAIYRGGIFVKRITP